VIVGENSKERKKKEKGEGGIEVVKKTKFCEPNFP